MIFNQTGNSIPEICLEENVLSKAELDHIVDMRCTTEPALPLKRKKG